MLLSEAPATQFPGASLPTTAPVRHVNARPVAAAPTVAVPRAPAHAASVEVWDASSGREQPVTGASMLQNSDPVIATAVANAYAVDSFFRTTFGRDGIDGKGAPLRLVVHAPDEDGGIAMNNAYWDRTRKRIFVGDGDGQVFGPLGGALDVMVHEATHAIVDSSVNLRYSGQQGGINESWADVMGALADPDDWLVGEDVFTPHVAGDAIRDLEHPNFSNVSELPRIPMDPHDLSEIPSLAAVRVAQAIGRREMGQIWYTALVEHLDSRAGFAGAARATLDAAVALHGAGSSEVTSVLAAWKSVGVNPRWKGAKAA